MRPQHHMYSDRAQPPPGTSHSSSRNTSFHSAPVPLPSHHAYDERTAQDQVRYKNNPHSMGEASPAVSNSATSSPMSSSEIQTGHHHQQSPASISSGSHVKRKRHELASAARLVSPTSMEGDEFDENDSVARGAEDMEGQGVEDMDEDHRERAALKRHASTGTLPSQARNSTMSAMSPDHHLYHRQGDLGGGRDYPVTTPSPGPRENESGGHFRWGSSESAPQSRLSPPSGSVTASSIGSTSPGSRANNGSSKDYRNRRPNGVVSSPISSVASSSGALSGAVSTSATMAASGTPSGTASVVATTSSSSSTPYNKTTVQFSEVVEYAQQLQTKYGGRCPDHSWGCVELADDYHLELSIKMYMDWAGLVASGRLTMDELPDLPEFRRPSSGGSLDTSSPTITTLRSSPALKSEDQSPTTSSLASGQFTFAHSGNQQRPRSPSSSSIFGSKSGSGQTPREGFISDSLMSRIGNPPPHMIPSPPSATAKQSSGSPSSVSARARARKMASSPSLGQHSSFQRFGLSSPPVPPVPTIPSSIVAQGQAQTQAERVPVKKTSQGGPAGQGSLRSEEMELSPDEDVVLRQAGSRAVFQRRVGGESGRQGREYEHERDLENEDMDMDEAQMMDDVETHRSSAQFKREQQYRRESYERRPEPAPASAPAPAPAPRERAQEVKVNPDMDSDVDDDEERGSDPYLRPAEVRKKSSGNGASSAKRHQHRERQDEGAYNDYEHSSRYHRSQEGQNLQHQQEPWGNAYPNDRDRDYDRVEEVRMGIKSMSSSSSFGSPSMHKSASANGPSKINQDPMITTTSTAGMMANMPNQLSRTEQEEYRHRRVEGDNDMSMMET
ncbi:hypothetical protein BGZ58_003964 [Dissophora ornata]|nr:hypothetical protein BGZ58_003964 [Dissophora ornata]